MFRKRFLVLFAALVVALMIPATALAAGNSGNGNGNGTDHFGPFAGTSTDHGTCLYNAWALDKFDRYFMVHDNGDGTFSVREELKNGSFVTTGPVSPGGCETSSHHGTVLSSGITGTMTGFLAGTVTSSTYDPNGCSAPTANCSTVDGFLSAVFGNEGPATFTCDLGYAGCDFNFEYSSSDQSLQYHHWQDKSDNHGGEQFIGDIANS